VTVDSQTLTRTNSYSLAGSPLRSVDRQGRVVDTSYDMLGRPVEQRWYGNTTDADADTNRQNAVADKHIVRPVMVKRRGSHGSSVPFVAIFLVVTWVDVCPMGWYDWRMELLGRTTWSYWEGQHCTRRRQSPVNIIA